MKHIERLEKELVPSRDFKYDYFGFKTLQKSYLLPFNNKETWETPQYMLMRVNVGLWCEIPVDPKAIKLAKQVQKFLLDKLKCRTYIVDLRDEEVATMTIDAWWHLLGGSRNDAVKVVKFIQERLKPLPETSRRS